MRATILKDVPTVLEDELPTVNGRFALALKEVGEVYKRQGLDDTEFFKFKALSLEGLANNIRRRFGAQIAMTVGIEPGQPIFDKSMDRATKVLDDARANAVDLVVGFEPGDEGYEDELKRVTQAETNRAAVFLVGELRQALADHEVSQKRSSFAIVHDRDVLDELDDFVASSEDFASEMAGGFGAMPMPATHDPSERSRSLADEQKRKADEKAASIATSGRMVSATAKLGLLSIAGGKETSDQRKARERAERASTAGPTLRF